MAQAIERDNPERDYERWRSLQGALSHVRAARGVLDTSPLTRDVVADADKLADKLERQLKPIEIRLAEAGYRLRRTHA